MRLYNTLSRAGRGGRSGRAGPGEDVRVRPDRVPLGASGEPAHLHAGGSGPARRRVRGIRRHPGPEHHRRRAHDRRILTGGRRQDAPRDGGRGAAAARDRGEVHEGGPRRHGCRRHPAPGSDAEGHGAHPRDDRAHGDADRARARLRRGLRLRLLRRREFRGLREALREHPGQAEGGPPGPRDGSGEAAPRRLRALEIGGVRGV